MANIKFIVDDYKKNYETYRYNLKEKCSGIRDFNILLNIAETAFPKHWWSYHGYKNKRKESLNTLNKVILENQNTLGKCANFAEILETLHDFTNLKELADIEIGPTLLYDLALVFGISINSYPEKVYVNNTATELTAKAILGANYKLKKQNYYNHICFNISDFPQDMQVLKAYEIEDFLCIYYSDFINMSILR